MLRLKAEAEAADKAQRLRVYSEQLAEYAADKASTADALLSQAQSLVAALQPVLAVPANGAPAAANGAGAPPLAAQLAALQQQLEQAALEARHFAEQQRADVDRSKRSSQQVRRPAGPLPRGRGGPSPARAACCSPSEPGRCGASCRLGPAWVPP
jgi:hypothetical protein